MKIYKILVTLTFIPLAFLGSALKAKTYVTSNQAYLAVQVNRDQKANRPVQWVERNEVNTVPYDEGPRAGQSLTAYCQEQCKKGRFGINSEAAQRCNYCRVYSNEGSTEAKNFPNNN